MKNCVKHQNLLEEDDKRQIRSGLLLQEGPFNLKNLPSLWTVAVTNHKPLVDSDIFIGNVATAYRDIFGHSKRVDQSSWEEYLKCNKCEATITIEEVFDFEDYVYLGDLDENRTQELPKCASCSSEMSFFYEAEKLAVEIRKQLARENCFASFLIDEKLYVYGFFLAWIDKLKNVWREKISGFYANTNLTCESFIDQVSTSRDGSNQEDLEYLYLAEVGQILPARNAEILFAIFRSFLSSLPEHMGDMPTIVTSESQKRSFMYLEAADHEVVCEVEDFPLKVLSGSVGSLQKKWFTNPKNFFAENRVAVLNWESRVGKK